MSSLIITKAASNELLRQSIYRGTPGKIFLYLQQDNLDVGWMFLRVNVWQESGIPVARTDGLTVYAPDSQKSLLDDLTLDHYQDLTGVAISINKWWKTRYPEFKMRIVSKKEFEHIKMQEQQQQQ